MARYTGPLCKRCRRERQRLFLKGARCLADRCALARRQKAPGQHGRFPRKQSEYGLRLREKQKLRRMYGVMEGQFRETFRKAARQRGATGENLLRMLECRLDNVVFRLGFARSRGEARQLVGHGHFTVNGRKVDISSYQVSEGDQIGPRKKSGSLGLFGESRELAGQRELPGWLEVDPKVLRGVVKRVPSREEIAVPVEEKLVVELYSR